MNKTANSSNTASNPDIFDDAEESSVNTPKTALLLGALGVVFGDIGTSPLYTLHTVFSIHHGAVTANQADVFGVLSMITWCLILIICITYANLILRADNDGEGGILSLAALIRYKLGETSKLTGTVFVLAVIGTGLFYGDSLITPAISVLSAMEGMEVVDPDAGAWIVPGAVIILALLFFIQPRGTETIGKAFGPIMVLWFAVLAVLGLIHLVQNPIVLLALSPTYAIAFSIEHPMAGFLATGAIVLAITGVEAMYADLGHFGRKAIVWSWFIVVFPALLLNYYGQGAMILSDPSSLANPFFHLAPNWAKIPLIILATLSTIIASQAVISGAFSASRQATRSSVLPRLRVVQTSNHEGGQIYIPTTAHILFIGVLALVLIFQSSESLANAYGLSVTGTMVLTFILFLILARTVWHWQWYKIILLGLIVGGVEIMLFVANAIKLFSGGWLPLLIAAVVVIIMLTWRRGSKILFGQRAKMEGSIDDFVRAIHKLKIQRVPGVAVYPHGNPATTPLALRAGARFNRVLHEKIIIITILNIPIPHVQYSDRVEVKRLGDPGDGFYQILYKVGFNDSQNIPRALRLAVAIDEHLTMEPNEVIYILSVFRIEPGNDKRMNRWQKTLFRILERFSANRTQVLHLPPRRTIVMGEKVEL